MRQVTFLLGLGALFSITIFVLNIGTSPTAQQPDCCPAACAANEPRFSQGAHVTVYLDGTFLPDEITLITAGFQDWNGRPNNSGVTYTVVTGQPLPPPGTHNTIVGYGQHNFYKRDTGFTSNGAR